MSNMKSIKQIIKSYSFGNLSLDEASILFNQQSGLSVRVCKAYLKKCDRQNVIDFQKYFKSKNKYR